jgi:hypothetical protein
VSIRAIGKIQSIASNRKRIGIGRRLRWREIQKPTGVRRPILIGLAQTLCAFFVGTFRVIVDFCSLSRFLFEVVVSSALGIVVTNFRVFFIFRRFLAPKLKLENEKARQIQILHPNHSKELKAIQQKFQSADSERKEYKLKLETFEANLSQLEHQMWTEVQSAVAVEQYTQMMAQFNRGETILVQTQSNCY